VYVMEGRVAPKLKLGRLQTARVRVEGKVAMI
jgi:hypothetical protein